MSTMITGDELRRGIEEETFVKGGDVDCAEGVKYDFRLGPMILKAAFGQPVDLRTREPAELFIDPGEVVFVLSEERLVLPADVVAQLSPKRRLSHDGILSIGGLFIDPAYQGKLLIGLFNISSTRFPLILHKKLIAATFYRLVGEELGEFPSAPPPVDKFPDDLIKVIREYQPIAIQKLAASLEGLEIQVSDIRREMRDREDWAERFQGYLDANNNQIEQVNAQIKQLTEDLQAETKQRKAGEDKITSVFAWLRGAVWVLVGIGGLATAIFLAWVTGKLPGP